MDQTIILALHKTLATLQHLTAEDRFTAIRQVRGILQTELHKGRPRINKPAYRPEHRSAHAEDLPPGVQQRDLDGKLIRTTLPPLPDNEPPSTDLLMTTRQECRAYCTTIYKAWKARRDNYPDGEPIRTYRPETSQLRRCLTAAMAKSMIAKVQQYNSSLLLPENALKSYDEIYKALREIDEDCSKDAISRAIANSRDKNANQSSGGSGTNAVNSLTGPAAGIKHRFSYSRQILIFCKFVLICPFLSCICLDKNKTNYFLTWWIKKVFSY